MVNEINAEGSVLIYAANFSEPIILELIRIGADVNLSIKESGVTPLHAAASQDLPETGRILIENGANINAQSAMAVNSKFFILRIAQKQHYIWLRHTVIRNLSLF